MQNTWIENNSKHTVKVDIITRATLNMSPKIALFVQLVAESDTFPTREKKQFWIRVAHYIFTAVTFFKDKYLS